MKIKHALGIGLAGCLALATLPAFGLGGTKEVAPAEAGITAPADVTPTIDPRSGGVTDWVPPESEFHEPVDLDKKIAQAKEAGIEFIIHEDAKFSRIEISDAITKLLQSNLVDEFGITSAGVRHDGSGINLTFKAAAPKPFPVDKFRHAAGIPCDFEYEENGGEIVELVGKHTDAAPYSGGARINFS